MFVKLLDHGIQQPINMIIADAKTCYLADPVDITTIKQIDMDIKKRLFEPGHHTTFIAPSSLSFQLEGLAVSTFTLGLHLASPFYNSGQRSGRFCSDMFENLDTEPFRNKLQEYFSPDNESLKIAMAIIKTGIAIFQDKKETATWAVEEQIRKDRPKASDKYIAANARKIAQEQLRVFISTIVPSGAIFNTNLIALACLYRTAFTPEMSKIVDMMVKEVLEKFPDLAFLFNNTTRRQYFPELDTSQSEALCLNPEAVIKYFDEWPENSINPTTEEMFPLDTLRSDPRFMDLAVRDIKTRVKLSLMTMGQDQRHRTIKRSRPCFTGSFFVPPIISKIGLEEEAYSISSDWYGLYQRNPPMASFIAPYGMMVTYDKSADFTAFIHEQGKRTCNCAQGEIYEMARQVREDLSKRQLDHGILRFITPPCYYSGQCVEGDRYCGRDMSKPFNFARRII